MRVVINFCYFSRHHQKKRYSIRFLLFCSWRTYGTVHKSYKYKESFFTEVLFALLISFPSFNMKQKCPLIPNERCVL